MLTFQELISNGQFESDACTLLRKPHFLLRDSIKEDEEILYDNNYKWLRQIGNWRFFLPNMEQMFPLLYLQSMYIRRLMDWDLTKSMSASLWGKSITILFTQLAMVGK